MKLLKKDVFLEEIEKIWITLSPSQREALMLEAIRGSHLNRAIEALPAIQMEVSKANALKGNDKK